MNEVAIGQLKSTFLSQPPAPPPPHGIRSESRYFTVLSRRPAIQERYRRNVTDKTMFRSKRKRSNITTLLEARTRLSNLRKYPPHPLPVPRGLGTVPNYIYRNSQDAPETSFTFSPALMATLPKHAHHVTTKVKK